MPGVSDQHSVPGFSEYLFYERGWSCTAHLSLLYRGANQLTGKLMTC